MGVAEYPIVTTDARRVSAHAKKPKKKNSRVSKKISYLVHEGTPQKQAVAEALSMERAGRLTDSGDYIRAKKGAGY
jgi:hypothetical protein